MITEGYLVRHYQGASGARDAALLDVAQDHLLSHLQAEGLFNRGIVFKGGTALRKFRAGNLGRFSTDLDFSAPDEALALDVLSAVDGAEIFGFRFMVERLGNDVIAGHARGRNDDDEITLFNSVGIGLQDLAIARLLIEHADRSASARRIDLSQ